MELNELKSGWQNAGGTFRSDEELQQMTKVFNHPALKKIRRKLIIESVLLLFVLFIYYDWFDGNTKPLYANILLVAGLLLYILNDVIGYITIAKPVTGNNLRISIIDYLTRIKRLSVYSLVVTCLYSVSLIIYFTSTINFTKEKAFLLLFGVIVIIQLILLSSGIWRKQIKNLKQQADDFNFNEQEI